MQGSITEEINNRYPERASSEESQAGEIKRCADCGTSKTPLWRGGPAGHKVYISLFLSLNRGRWICEDD